jgi:monoamine oxidase
MFVPSSACIGHSVEVIGHAWRSQLGNLITSLQIRLCLQVSLLNWNQDERFGAYGGPHAMVMGGYGQVTDALAAEILDLQLKKPVRKVIYTADGVEVHTRGGEIFIGDAAIVSVPIGVLKADTIQFDPELPHWKQAAISRIGMGKLNKVCAALPPLQPPQLPLACLSRSCNHNDMPLS